MRIAVVGIGGVGGYYGGKLARHYHSQEDVEVIFVARGEHLRRIRENGLKLIHAEGEFLAKPDLATDDPAALGKMDLVIFSVKGYDLESAAKQMGDNIGEKTAVLPLLNGVDNAEKLKALLPGGRILNGCVYLSAFIEAPGVVRQAGGSCKLFFGPEGGSTEAFRPIEKILGQATIDALLVENILEVVWEKYLFLSPIAGVTSLYREPFGPVMADKEKSDLLLGLMGEVKKAADAEGVRLPQDIVERSRDMAAGFPPETKSSMQLDFERGKRTELESLAGYIVRKGPGLGLEVPLHNMVYSRLTKKLQVPKVMESA